MNTIRTALVIAAATFLLVGCDWFGSDKAPVSKTLSGAKLSDVKVTYEDVKRLTVERDAARKELEELKKNPPKGEVITTGIPLASCQTMIQEAVVKNCQAKPAWVAKKPISKPQHKAPPANKQEKVDKPLPSPVPQPMPPMARAPGGCIYTSDGNLILKGHTEKLAAGVEVARIKNEDLWVKFPKLVSSIPDGFVTNDGHKALCQAWSNAVAQEIQSPEGRRVNDDTHRTQ